MARSIFYSKNRAWLCYISKVYIWRKRLRCSETTFFKTNRKLSFSFIKEIMAQDLDIFFQSVQAWTLYRSKALLMKGLWTKGNKKLLKQATKFYLARLKNCKKKSQNISAKAAFLNLTIHNINHTDKKVINDFVELSWT